MATSAPIFTSANRSAVWMMTSMFSRVSVAEANRGRFPSSASIRRSSGWKITSTAIARPVRNLLNNQSNTRKSSAVVTTVSTSSTSKKPSTIGQPRVPRTNIKA